MEFHLHTCGPITILRVPTSALDTQIDVHRLDIALRAAVELDEGPALMVIDFKHVESISNLGAMPLLTLRKALQDRDGRLVVVHPNGAVREYFHRSRLDRVIQLVENLDEAFAWITDSDCDLSSSGRRE